MADLCPPSTLSKQVNIEFHMMAFKHASLGPADPRQPSDAYWKMMMDKWKVPEGEARSRLCMNCEHYMDDPENVACVQNGPGGKLKASELPIIPKWADIDGLPQAVCSRWGLTCSSIRTCVDWEPRYTHESEMDSDDDM